MKRYVIIAAGGSGSRMSCHPVYPENWSGDRNILTPKQFLELAGKPILMHTLNAFCQSNLNIKIILVLPQNQITTWEELCNKYKFSLNHTIIHGGKTRFHSVKNGLSLIEEDSLIAVHDGVRPLISVNLINKVFESAEKLGNAIPVIPVNESIRNIKGAQNTAINRNDYRIIQTPQCFRADVIKNAFKKAWHGSKPCHASELYTDEASVVEAAGEKIHLIEGESRNIKITTPEDILIAEALMSPLKKSH
ncbi:MAG: 2-C-methyl-D-erythritol 4-phosphate cytidylyltransferase [Bacteroidota bacterium]